MTSDPATLFGPGGSLLDVTCERYIAGDLDELELFAATEAARSVADKARQTATLRRVAG